MKTQPGLPQYLNYKVLVAPGVVQLKDGAFLSAYELHGPDQEYAAFLKMEYVAEQINQDLAKLSSGWAVQAEAIRVPVVVPPCTNHCPDITSQLIAEERAAEYAAEGKHFELRHVLALTWLPPSEVGQSVSNWLFGQRYVGKKKPSREVLLGIFQAQTKQITEALGHDLKLRRLNDEELKRFLRLCVTGEDRVVGGERLDEAIGTAVWETRRQKMQGQHVRVVGIYGYPKGTSPQMLDDLLRLPYCLRLSQRIICLSFRKAVKELEEKYNKWNYTNWYNPKKIGWGTAQNITKVDPNKKGVVRHNRAAEKQGDSVDDAILGIEEGEERAAHYTQIVVLQDKSEEQVEQQAAEVKLLLDRKGFTAVIETDNSAHALRGSWPGHASENVRRSQLTTRHFSRLWVTSTPWRGPDKHPSPLYPKNSGPLIICKSTGHTPFFFSPRLHSFIIGPTEAGKTTLLNSWSAAHLQYEGAQVCTFDLDGGGFVANQACGGEYFDLDTMQYAPFAHIDQENEYTWALDFCERLAGLRNYEMNWQAQRDLARALRDLAKAPREHRTMTGLLAQLQTQEKGLEQALSYYAGTNPGAVLDGQYSPTVESHWLSFDMEQIQKRAEAVRVPVFLAQLHVLDRRISDGRPTQMFFEEGWRVAGDVLLRDFIEEASATMRKKVVSLGLVLHSPGDLSIFPHADRLVANIDTYVFLPNAAADTPAMRKHYADLGLGSREIKMLADPTQMQPRRDYYTVQGNQRRKFQLPWGEWQAALFAVNGRDEKPGILQLRQQHGTPREGASESWLPAWLNERGHAGLANQWSQRTIRKEAA